MPALIRQQIGTATLDELLEEQEKQPPPFMETIQEIGEEQFLHGNIGGAAYESIALPPLARKRVGGGRAGGPMWEGKTAPEVAKEGDELFETPEQYRKSDVYDPAAEWEPGLTRKRAQVKKDWNNEKRVRQLVYDQRRPYTSFVTRFGVGMIDPINIVPGLGPMQEMSTAAKIAWIAAGGAATNVMLDLAITPFKRSIDKDEMSADIIALDALTGAGGALFFHALGHFGKAFYGKYKEGKFKALDKPPEPEQPKPSAATLSMTLPSGKVVTVPVRAPGPTITSPQGVTATYREPYDDYTLQGDLTESLSELSYGPRQMRTYDNVIASSIIVSDANNALNDGRSPQISEQSKQLIMELTPQFIHDIETQRYGPRVQPQTAEITGHQNRIDSLKKDIDELSDRIIGSDKPEKNLIKLRDKKADDLRKEMAALDELTKGVSKTGPEKRTIFEGYEHGPAEAYEMIEPDVAANEREQIRRAILEQDTKLASAQEALDTVNEVLNTLYNADPRVGAAMAERDLARENHEPLPDESKLPKKTRDLLNERDAAVAKVKEETFRQQTIQAETHQQIARRRGYRSRPNPILEDMPYHKMGSHVDLPPEIQNRLPQGTKDMIDLVIRESPPNSPRLGVRIKQLIAPHIGSEYAGTYRVFHGSPHVYENYDSSVLGATTGAGSAREGFHFASSPGTTEWYSRFKEDTEDARPDLSDINDTIALHEGQDNDAIVKAVKEQWETDFKEQLPPNSILPERLSKLIDEYLTLRDSRAQRPTPKIDKRMADIEKEFRRLAYPVTEKIAPKPNTRAENVTLHDPYVYDWQGLNHRQNPAENMDYQAHIKRAKEQGNDGVIFLNNPDPNMPDTTFVAFNVDQIEPALQRQQSINWALPKEIGADFRIAETPIDEAGVQFSKPMRADTKFDKEMELDNIDPEKPNGVKDAELDRMDIEAAKAGMTEAQAKAFDEQIKLLEEDMASDERIAKASEAVEKCRTR